MQDTVIYSINAVDFSYQIVSMWKQGVPYDQIVLTFGLKDIEHLKRIIKEVGQCWGCNG